MRTLTMEKMMRRWAPVFIALLSMTAFLVPTTQAADEVAFRTVYHTQKVEMMEASDVPGHIIGVAQQSGLTFYTKGPASGQIATTSNTFHFDTVKGKGTFTNYVVNTFPDGSTLSAKTIGTVTPLTGGPRATIEGVYEIIGGTGKFDGTKGKGTYKGERLGSPQTGGDSYIDAIGTQWK